VYGWQGVVGCPIGFHGRGGYTMFDAMRRDFRELEPFCFVRETFIIQAKSAV